MNNGGLSRQRFRHERGRSGAGSRPTRLDRGRRVARGASVANERHGEQDDGDHVRRQAEDEDPLRPRHPDSRASRLRRSTAVERVSSPGRRHWDLLRDADDASLLGAAGGRPGSPKLASGGQ
jgi:hypothetical protein